MTIRYKEWEFDRLRREIRKGAILHAFKPAAMHPRFRINRRFQALEHLVLADGFATRESLFDVLYGSREDGGPLSARNIIDVMFAQMTPAFSALQVRLTRDKRAGTYYFSVQDVV